MLILDLMNTNLTVTQLAMTTWVVTDLERLHQVSGSNTINDFGLPWNTSSRARERTEPTKAITPFKSVVCISQGLSVKTGLLRKMCH